MISFAEWKNSKKKEQNKENSVSFAEWSNKKTASQVDQAYLDSFFADTDAFFKASNERYNTIGWSNAQSLYETTSKEWSDLRNRANKISTWAEYYKDQLDEETYNSITETLSSINKSGNSIHSGFHQNRNFYSYFDSEDEYNTWKAREDEKQAVLGAEDLEEYFAAGEAKAVREKWYSGIENNVAYLRNPENLEVYEKAAKRSSNGLDFGMVENTVLDKLEYKAARYMTEDEYKVYNYYVGKGETEKAQNYLNSLEDDLTKRQAGRLISDIEGNKLKEIFFAAEAGVDQFWSGVRNLDNLVTGAEADHTSATQYASSTIRENIDGGWGVAYDLANSTGNMLPSILVGSVTGGLGGALTMGVSSAGNGYAEMRNLGYDEWQSRGYGALVGASEAVLSYALGGISKLGGKVSGNAVGKLVSKIDNAIARTAITVGGNMASEGLEEAIQTALEPAFKALMTGEEFESAEWDDILYSALLGALSAGVLEGAPTIASTINSNYQTNVQMGGLSNKGAVSAFFKGNENGTKGFKGVSEAYKSGKQTVNENAGYYVNEALEIDPDNAHAQRMQSRLDSGKDVSGYQINRLIEANESTLYNKDSSKIKDAVVNRLLELGEVWDVNSVADAITKQTMGADLTATEKRAIQNSSYGYRVATELDPKNVGSGNLANKWAETIGTEKYNVDEYNRGIPVETETSASANIPSKEGVVGKAPTASVAPKEAPSVTENTPVKESATEAKFEASESAEFSDINFRRAIQAAGINMSVTDALAPTIKKYVSGEITSRAELADVIRSEFGDKIGTYKLTEDNLFSLVNVIDTEASKTANGVSTKTVSKENVAYKTESDKLVATIANERVSNIKGFTAEAANAMIRGYDGSINPSEYTTAFDNAFKMGQNGIPSSKLAGVINSGLSERVAYTAYELGRQSTKNVESGLNSLSNNGIINTNESEAKNESGESVHLRNGGKRDGGKNTKGQVSRVESSTGQAESRGKTSRIADSEAARLVNEGREVKVSGLGILGGSDSQTVKLVDKANETSSMKEARKKAEVRGLKVTFFVGDNLVIKDKSGEWISARAYIMGNHVFVRADHSLYTADQLMRHELGHDMIAKGEVDIKAVRERLEETVGKENIDEVAKYYIDAYAGTGMSAEAIWEECICDSLGDMNIFAGEETISKAVSPMLSLIKAEVNESKSPTQTRGSPTSKSVYDKRAGKGGWGKAYGTAQEALNDAIKGVDSKLWNAFHEELDSGEAHTPITNAIIAVQQDVRQDVITPIQGAKLLSEIYRNGGSKALDRLYIHETGNLYSKVLEKAKQYSSTAGEAVEGKASRETEDLYTATDAFNKEVAYGDRRAFARSLAHQTTGMSKGEIRTIYIKSTAKVYAFRADGYMHGEMIENFSQSKYEKIIEARKEYLNEIISDRKTADLWLTPISDIGTESRGDISLSEGRGRSTPNDLLPKNTSERNRTRDTEREWTNPRTEEEYHEIVNKLREMYGLEPVDYGRQGKASRELDSLGNEISPAVQKRFANSKVVDENGRLKVVYHGTVSGEFNIFDKAKGSVEGDFGSGFYFTDKETDVEQNYEFGGPDFENKVWRRAEQIWDEDSDIDMDAARTKAREELYKESHRFEVYLNIENPAVVGETILFDNESYLSEYNEEDYDSYDDYIGDVEQLLVDDVDKIIWDIERNIDLYSSTDSIRNALYDAYNEGGVDVESLKAKINELYLESTDGEIVGNEVTRQIIESLGYDGIIDSTVSSKFKNMGMEEGTTHYIAFKPNQIKSITNQNPTDNPDIRYSRELDTEYLSAVNSGDTETAQRMVDEAAKAAGYTVKAYHGTSRGDRVGNVFLPERATSGPMAFFTDNKEIADNYAKNKSDTSLAYDTEYDSYYTQFRVNRDGKNISIPELWKSLSFAEKNSIKEKAKHIKFDDDYENIIVDRTAEHGNGAWDAYTLNMHKGNALEALVDTWLESGDLYNQEAEFIKVLELVGISDVEYRDPDARHEKTYDTWLKIQKPFDTDNAIQSFYDGLSEWIENHDMSVYEKESSNADMWDKNNQSPESWLDKLSDDIANGTTHAWTVIPDFVTDYLKEQGYDGIKDKGGKGGGAGHTVWIPFSSEQVKSAEPVTYNDKGEVIPLSERFNPRNIDIRYSRELDFIDFINEQAGEKSDPNLTKAQKVAKVRGELEKINVGKGEVMSVMKLADKMFDVYGGDNSISDFRYGLFEATKLALNGTETGFEAAYDIIHTLAREVAYNPKNVGGEAQVLSEIKREIRGTKMSVHEADKTSGEFDKYGGYGEFRKRLFGKVNLANGGVGVDTKYMELQNLYGKSYFPDVNTISEQLMQIEELMNTPLSDYMMVSDAELEATTDEMVQSLFAKLGDIWSKAIKSGNAIVAPVESDKFSNRSLLAGALESAVQNDIERNKLEQYKQKINLINSEEQKLLELRTKIKELSFAKGPRDAEAIRKLQFEANQAANRINTYDKQLLNLESTKALKGVLEREKAQARKRDAQKYKEAIDRYREKSAQTQRELMDRYQESRRRGTESRNKTAMRHKIKGIVSELNTLLLNPTAKKHIKEELRKEVADALSAINMDTVGADERVAMYNDLIAKEKNPDVIAELTKTRDRIQLQGDNLKEKLNNLQSAYEKIKNTDDIELNLAYQEVIHNSIKAVSEKIGNTSIRNMTLEQLEMVYDLFSMIRHTIRDANKSFKEKKGQTITQMAEAVNDQVRTVGGQPYKRNAISASLQRIGWTFLKPLVAFRTIGSVTFTNMYKELRNGEDTFYSDVKEAQAFIEEQKKKHGYKSWDTKKTKTFTAKSGKSFDLTLEQMMSLYAYYKREQAHDHIIEGGIVFEDSLITEKNKWGVPIKYEVTTKDAFNLSEETFKEICDYLEKEHKEAAAFVNEMQAYLSDNMGAKGNEVSMQLLGVKLFKEKFYLPIKSSQYYMNFKAEEAGEVKLKSPAFSKETVKHANNPIVIHNFTDLWAEHINDMSMYHSFVLALEDFTRVYNYKTKTDAKVETMDTKATLETAYPGVTQYINKFLKDMNGGVRSETVGWAEKLTSLSKKGAVLGSASVTIQQPSAVMRAMAYINPKYFATTAHKSINLAKHKQDWAELKKYAPIAGIKEMGRFDVGMGQGTVDWIKSDKTVLEKAEDFLSLPPAFMDEVTWISIWNAVKKETVHNNPKLSTSSEEFLKLAGERFTDVISMSQVYDSVFSRSDLMRNKSWIAKSLTAYMAEPSTTLNMIWDSWVQAKRSGTVKGFAKAITTTGAPIVAATVLNAALKSIIMAMRDDDEDESYIEKYLEHFVGDLKDSLNPLGLIPFVKDIVSIFNGYDVERMDMALFSDLKKAIDAFDSDSKTLYDKWSGLIGAISAFFGVPVKNVERDIRGLITTVFGESEETTPAGMLNAIENGWTGKEKSNGQQLYEAMLNGDTAQVKRIEDRFKDQSAIDSAIRKALRENDPRIKEAAEALSDGDFSEYEDILNEIVDEGNFDFKNVKAAILKEYEDMTPDEETITEDKVEKEESAFETEWVQMAISMGDTATAKTMREEIINAHIANGKSREEAEASFNSSFGNSVKRLYEDGDISDSEAKSMLVNFGGKTKEEAESKVQYWSFKKQYPDYDLTESAVSKYYSDVKPSGISVEVYYDYTQKRSKAQGVDLNGDGKADSGSVKREVMQMINSLPISSYQKDALYYLNGWSQSTLWEAPWH